MHNDCVAVWPVDSAWTIIPCASRLAASPACLILPECCPVCNTATQTRKATFGGQVSKRRQTQIQAKQPQQQVFRKGVATVLPGISCSITLVTLGHARHKCLLSPIPLRIPATCEVMHKWRGRELAMRESEHVHQRRRDGTSQQTTRTRGCTHIPSASGMPYVPASLACFRILEARFADIRAARQAPFTCAATAPTTTTTTPTTRTRALVGDTHTMRRLLTQAPCGPLLPWLETDHLAACMLF